jgi:ATP diphosphatase
MRPIERLLEIMARLRDPDGGCPWDLEQSFATIAPYTIEEAYEVDDAIRRGDLDDLCGELGDLLLQVVFHAQLAREAGAFGFDEVAQRICDKLIARHPHVFGGAEIASAAAQTENWDRLKEAERRERAAARGRPPSALDEVPLGLPALLRAAKIQRRARRAGFEPPGAAPELARLEESLGGARDAEAIGALLFAAVELAARAEVDPEAALREATADFEARFRRAEAQEGEPDESRARRIATASSKRPAS